MARAIRMTIKQYLQIGRWLENNRNLIEEKGHSQVEVQILISSALGYEVPLSSIQKCAKAIEIQWAGSPLKPPPVPIDREAIIILIGALAGLYVETDRTIPDDLANLQSTYTKEKQSEKRN